MSEAVKNYNHVSRGFHWVIALLILGLLFVGFYMDQMAPAPFKYQLYGWHKALGITVLTLAIFRIIWKSVSKSPESLTTHKTWEKILSKTIHVVLYGAMLAMPLSGWVMSSAGGHPISFFNLFEVPSIVSENRELSRLANQIHGWLAYIIIGCVGLHIIGALKHHVFDRDTTLSRMGGNLVFVVLGLLILGAALFIPAQAWVQKLFAEDVTHVESVQKTLDQAE